MKGRLSISSNIDNGRVEILTVNGAVLISELFSNKNIELNLADLPKGIYFVKLMDEQGNQLVEKIVKQ